MQHVNGWKDVLLINNGTYTGGSCTVTCHGKFHMGFRW
jgi:hypothetical protein